MSEPIPESIPTSADPRSRRPTKRRALTPSGQHSASVEALFANPDREVIIPNGPKPKTLPPPPEIVANVQGSSAGAGSGEFHVYKASRRREYERLQMMDEEAKKEVADREFAKQKEELKRKDEAKTSKNKARREKRKAGKAKGKSNGAAEDGNGEGDVEMSGKENNGKNVKMKPKLMTRSRKAEDEDEDEAAEAINGGGNVKAVEEVGITIHDED